MNLKETIFFPKDAAYFEGHFKNKPIVPGVVLLSKVTAILKNENIILKEIISAKFFSPVLPEEKIIITIINRKESKVLDFKGFRESDNGSIVFSGAAKI